MFISNLKLTQFKNYQELKWSPQSRFNVIAGANGVGKTNLLDAIFYTCFCRSHLHKLDKYIIKENEKFFRIEATVETGMKSHSIIFKVQKGKKKELVVDGKTADRLSDHIGSVPCVMIAPNDVYLLTSGSDERRKIMDLCISQYDKKYLQNLILYNKVLKQRNSYLKSLEKDNGYDEVLLLSYDRQLDMPAKYIHAKRHEFMKQLNPVFDQVSRQITGGQEELEIVYLSSLSDSNFLDLLQKSRREDLFRASTSKGLHRDDLNLLMNGNPLKIFGSQGQMKSFILSLKLALFALLQDAFDKVPILLLDDVFDKLDENRIQHLIEYLENQSKGQIFISDVHLGRVPKILKSMGCNYQLFHIHSDSILELNSAYEEK